MKKTLLVIFCVLIVNSPALSKGRVSEGLCKVFLDHGEGGTILSSIEMQKGSDRNGVAIQFYINGEVAKIGWYSQGTLNGMYQSFWLNGNTRSILDYKHNKLHGRVYHFHPDGTPEFQLTFINGVPDRVGYFYRNGEDFDTVEYQDGRAVAIY